MKRFSLFLIIIFLAICSSSQPVNAQEKTKEEQEKEQKIHQAIDEQKKAMAEQKKAQEQASQILKEQQIITDEVLKDVRVEVDKASNVGATVIIRKPGGSRSFNNDEEFVFSTPKSFYGHSIGDSERTTWDFSKSVRENTFSKDYTFDVGKSVKTVVMSVMGDCKAGEIRINIVMPDGKKYSEIVIDELGNLNWRKSFKISETENQDKAGEWKFQITSTRATGFFKISLQTY